MRDDYRLWLKDKGIGGQYAIDIENKIENAYGDLEEHFKNGTYQNLIDNLEYSTKDKNNNEPNTSKITPKGELKNDLYSYLSGYKTPLKDYLKFLEENPIDTYDEYQEILNNGIKHALKCSPEDRAKRLKNASKKPSTRTVTTTAYNRNPDVVAEVLTRANGICENCKSPAPFIRKSDNTPYLEVHHIKQLADGGDDTVENALALCPNCHREKHSG